MELSTPYSASPLRRKSLAVSKSIRLSIIPSEINDDEAERINRRRRESQLLASTPISSSNNRQSFGTSHYAHLSSNQLQEKILQCIQLNAENKITIKNAFSLPAIDVLTYFVKMNKEPDLQVASSSLDVSSKVYGLRVDKVYLDVNKMCSSMGKDNMNDNQADEELNEQVQDNLIIKENGACKQKKKKRKKGNVFSTITALKGTAEVNHLDVAMFSQDDPQTTDVLNQIQAVFHIKGGCYMSNFDAPILDTLQDVNNKYNAYHNLVIDSTKIPKFLQLSFPFSFLKWIEDTYSDEENQFNQDMEIDNDEQANIFHFDVDEVTNNTPFPTQNIDASIIQQNKQTYNETNSCVVDFYSSIELQTNNKRSEYTYLPHDLIHFSGPLYWKVVKRRNIPIINNEERCKQQKKKKIIIPEFDSNDNIDFKFSSGPRVKCTESTLNAWDEDRLISYHTTADIDDFDMFQCFSQNGRYIKMIKKHHVQLINKEVTITQDVFENDCDALNDEINFSNSNDDDQHFNNYDQNGETEVLTQGTLMGDNLVDAPHLVQNIYIPYSKRAKKIDVRQVKKSMISLLKTNLNISSNKNINDSNRLEDEIENESFYKFSDMYKQLPRFLTKANTEAMSVPIAFVSLLHLANEKTLNIKSFNSSEDLVIKQD